jgi:3-oxoacyl-[acyl-carrier protein] reductase
MKMELHGKTVLITGGAGGIGTATAVLFAARGCNVAVNYNRSGADAEKVAAKCRNAGGKAIALQADVSCDADCRRLVDAVVMGFGGLDVLVNNAAVTEFVHFSNLEGLTEEIWERLFRVNVFGTFYCTRAAVSALKKSDKGTIINLASTAGLFATGSSIAYAASKAAVVNLTKALARALGPGIRVNAVAPGPVDTQWIYRGLGQSGAEALTESLKETTLTGRITTAADVADAIVWLAAGAANITGEIITVDGGLHLKK